VAASLRPSTDDGRRRSSCSFWNGGVIIIIVVTMGYEQIGWLARLLADNELMMSES
jgi:hypothetical protein